MNPFDIRAALLAKHARSAWCSFIFPSRCLSRAYHLIFSRRTPGGAAISTVPAVATEILAWPFQLEGQKLKGALLMHLVLGSTSAILIWIAGVLG